MADRSTAVSARFAASSYDFRALVVELVSHEAFRYLAEPEESP